MNSELLINNFVGTDVNDINSAHKEAYEKAHILHRDISVGNIMITSEGRGLLIDWDMCKRVTDLPTVARQSERTVCAFIKRKSYA